MKDYTNTNPEFADKIKILEPTDPDHADNYNKATKQLLDNDIYLKNKISKCEETATFAAEQANKEMEGTFAYDIYHELSEIKKSVADGKKTVASAISGMNQATAANAAYSAMAANIKKISSDATAQAGHILTGKTAYAGGSKITGTMADNGTIHHTLGINKSYTIPAGYHNGQGQISQNIGTQEAQTIIPGTSDKYISPGKYLTGIQTIKGDTNLVPENIAKGKSIFGVNGIYVTPLSGIMKIVLGERQIPIHKSVDNNVGNTMDWLGGPDGIVWRNYASPAGEVATAHLDCSAFKSQIHPEYGVIVRTISYSSDASKTGKNSYVFGPSCYSDYWVPGKICGSLDGHFNGWYIKFMEYFHYSFDWGASDFSELNFMWGNLTSGAITWLQHAWTVYPIVSVSDESGFNARDILGL